MRSIRFLQKAVRFRWILVFLAHLCLYAAAYFLSFLLRFDFHISAYFHSPSFWIGGALILLFRTGFGAYFGLYQRVLKYAGMPSPCSTFRFGLIRTGAFRDRTLTRTQSSLFSSRFSAMDCSFQTIRFRR